MGADRAAPVPSGEASGRGGRWLPGATCLLVGLVVAANVYLFGRTRAAVIAEFARTPPHPYAMVLGTHVGPNGVPSFELEARLETGRQLYRAGLARRIIVSGLARPGYDEPDNMAAWLERRGVAPADVVIDRGGYRTAASMADASQAGVKSLLVVSQDYHLPRALYIASHAGIAALGVPASEPDRTIFHQVFVFVRETAARTEIIFEIALRGVRGLPAGQIPTAPTG